MGVRERILTIRLMDKANANPAAAEKLGIVVINGPGDPCKSECVENGR